MRVSYQKYDVDRDRTFGAIHKNEMEIFYNGVLIGSNIQFT